MNIKENLLKMKDMTELMLDLAYSAVFLRDKQITDKVKEMHKEIAILEESTFKMLFRIREPEEERMFLVDIIDSIKDISNAALHIAELSMTRQAPSIIRDILSQTTKRYIAVKISPKSPYARKIIGDLKIRSETGASIMGIKRDGVWDFNIDSATKLMPDDEVMAIGSVNADKIFKKKASG